MLLFVDPGEASSATAPGSDVFSDSTAATFQAWREAATVRGGVVDPVTSHRTRSTTGGQSRSPSPAHRSASGGSLRGSSPVASSNGIASASASGVGLPARQQPRSRGRDGSVELAWYRREQVVYLSITRH
jgi:hypothetical protein